MITIVQHIKTYWTKKSRGNPGATLRNAVPENFPIEDTPSIRNAMPDEFSIAGSPNINGVLLKEIKFSELSEFRDPVISDFKLINENQQRQLGFKFEELQGTLLVSKWGFNLKKIGKLKANTWLKVIENERIPIEHTWAYYKHVYNIYYGHTSSISSGLSTQSPTIVLNLERNLW